MAGATAMWMLTRREVARYLNVWGQTIIPPVVSAALMLFVFGHALGERIGTFDGVPYLTFIVPGLVVQGAITNAYNNTGSSLFDARRARYIEDILTSPLSAHATVFGYALAGTTRGVAIGILTLAISLPVARSWEIDVPLFALVLVASCFLFSLVGILAALSATRWDHIFVPVTFVLTPLTFLGGVFYPVSLLPPDLAAVSRWNPILYIVDAQRQSLLGTSELHTGASVLVLLALCAAAWGFTLHRFRTSPRLRA